MTSTRRLRQNDHGVPHHLIEDILAKLPVKSLVRFKYVSEQWFRLINDPRFIDLHLSNQLKNDEIYHLNQDEVIVMFDLHNEKFQAIPHPSCCSNKPRRPMQLGTLRECLCLAHLELDSQLLNIWIMDKQQQKITWEKLYCIEVFRNRQLLIGPRFTFAEHKCGTLLVCSGGVVYLFKPNNEICCL
ncbi:hypothetical protein V6N13_014604 [Hibiscus sabdariffa]|uniref:F-box domain-containing protein n=1 Tax=Hibiscus sabdariffa TaxID=183260 RepID=A0ABR2RVZ0_9ROSI